MADILEVWKKCTNCNGTGKVTVNDPDPPFNEGPEQEIDCSVCDGNGELLWGEMRERELPGR